MDLAVTLLKSVMRVFYSTREILVVDALILHEALRDDDLAYLMSMNTKDLHKVCGKLREDRFLTVHSRSELRPGNPRPSNRTWYYINYRHTIDAIKWRLFTVLHDVQGTTIQASEKKEYFCSFCGAEWTQMEVLDHWGASGFLCHRCNHLLTNDSERNSGGGHEQSTRLNDQLQFIIELLPKIDSVTIPECDFDRAFAKARPVQRDITNPGINTYAADPGSSRPMAVRGMTNTGPQSIAINISTSDGPSEADKEAERLRKEKIAQQNELPSWMSSSTVTGESYGGTAGANAVKKSEDTKGSQAAQPDDGAATAEIDDIFERLKAEHAAARAREGEEDEDEFGSDEDEDEFEDVPATNNNSGMGTPLLPAIKQEPSGLGSGVQSGLVSRDSNSSDERATKRVKVEPVIKKEDDSVEDEDDDDDEMEFEDV